MMTLTQQLNDARASGLCNSIEHCFHGPKMAAPAQDITSIVKAGRWRSGSVQPCHPFFNKPKAFPEHSEQTSFMSFWSYCIIWPFLDGKQTEKANI